MIKLDRAFGAEDRETVDSHLSFSDLLRQSDPEEVAERSIERVSVEIDRALERLRLAHGLLNS